jgi:ADP-ribosylglycohydrolase
MVQKDKFIGCLVGCAIGDALGMPVEGWPKARIQTHAGKITDYLDPIILRDESGEPLAEDEFGPIHNWTEVFAKGEYTDDTILTLAIAESIIECGLPDPYHLTQKQLQIYEEFSQERSKCGFGGTTKAAFENLKQGKRLTESGVIGGPGTGPAMKTAPIGLWMSGRKMRREIGLFLADLVAQSTHLDPRSRVCAVIQTDLIENLVNDELHREYLTNFCGAICDHWEEELTNEFKWYKKGNIADKIEWISLNRRATVEEAHAYLGSSSAVYRAYPFVLWMLQKFWYSPVDGLIELVNCGGDCDTTGAMYGALIGAKHGITIFPQHLLDGLNGLENIVAIATDLHSVCSNA